MLWETLFRDGALGKYALPLENGGGLSMGLLMLCASPGKGMLGADGLRARDSLLASSSAAAISRRLFSARLIKGVVGDTMSWKSLVVELG